MLDAVTELVPLAEDADGVIRVRGSRVTLDVLLAAFDEGATAEEIVQQYPTLSLADVYQILGYALRHSVEMHAYRMRRLQFSDDLRERTESRCPPAGLRDRLLGRRR